MKNMAQLMHSDPAEKIISLSHECKIVLWESEIIIKNQIIYFERRQNMLHKFGKKILTVMTSMAAVVLSSPLAFAVEAIPAGDTNSKAMFAVGAMIAAGLAIGIGAVGAGLGIGTAASGACGAVGRNPGVQGKIMMTMLVGMAMAESIAIYALVVSLVLLYANPYMRYFFG